MIICIVGKSGSGKSYISRLLKSYSDKIVFLDIDQIGHYVLTLQDVKENLIREFGNQIINNGVVDRKRLSKIVFNSKDKMDKLSNITWESMEKVIDKYIYDNQNKIIVLDYLLLPKTKYFNISDLNILIDAPYETRKNRVLIRDNITEEKFIEREKASLNLNDYTFDYVINNIEKNKTKRKVRDIYDKSIIHRQF